jgi:hypothetical protein
MDRDPGTGLQVDPLAELEVQRALALARARESYPAVPRETLLGYCEAAWDVALKADPRGRDLQGSFDRALLIIAWTQRRSGGRVPLRELIDQTVPRIALEPFIARPGEPKRVPEVGIQPEEAVPSRRSPLRLPFSSPIPVGAAVAAGVVGVGVLSRAEVIPIAPLEPTGSDEAASDDVVAARADRERASKQAAAGAARGPREVAGLMSQGTGDSSGQAFAAPAAPVGSAAAPAAPSAKAARDDGPRATGKVKDGAAVQMAAQTAGAEAAPPAPVTPAPAAPPPQPVVRVEMEPTPTAIILEVSAPPRPATPEPDAESPADPVSDEAAEPERDRHQARDDEVEEQASLDVLEDLGGRDEEDGEEAEPEPAQPVPVTPPAPEVPVAEEAPAAPAPVEPAPAPAPAPVEPAPAPAPVEPAPAPAPPAPPAPTA